MRARSTLPFGATDRTCRRRDRANGTHHVRGVVVRFARGANVGGVPGLVHTASVIMCGALADYPAVAEVVRRASLSNAGDRETLLAHPEHLILPPDGLAEGRTHATEQGGSVVGFATWIQTRGRCRVG
jgi:hypothetical protein